MPTYEYRCPKGHVFEEVHPMAESSQPRACHCGEVGSRIISKPPRVFGDIEPYESPASGKWITSKRERLEDFRATGTREYELGEKEEWLKRAPEREAAVDAQVEHLVKSTAQEMGLSVD